MSAQGCRAPSIKALLTAFPRLTREDADGIRILLQSGKGLPAVDDAYGAKLDTYGTEYIPAGRGCCSPSIAYLNRGETYAVTIRRLGDSRTYSLGSWGDVVEHGHYE